MVLESSKKDDRRNIYITIIIQDNLKRSVKVLAQIRLG